MIAQVLFVKKLVVVCYGSKQTAVPLTTIQ